MLCVGKTEFKEGAQLSAFDEIGAYTKRKTYMHAEMHTRVRRILWCALRCGYSTISAVVAVESTQSKEEDDDDDHHE